MYTEIKPPVYTNGAWSVFELDQTYPSFAQFSLWGPGPEGWGHKRMAVYQTLESAKMQADANAKGDAFRAKVKSLTHDSYQNALRQAERGLYERPH